MPRPRLHLERAKAHLNEHGRTRAGALSDALGITPAVLIAAMKPGLAAGEVIKTREDNGTYYELGDGTAPAAGEDDEDPGPFNASLWADGDLDLYGVTPLEGGGVRVSPDGVRLLCRLLHGQGPEA